MNEKQKEWTKQKQEQLDAYIESHFPLSDEDAEHVVKWVGEIIDMAKGEKDDCRDEVRRALFDVLEKWERKLHEST